jgi:hypothetical protein
MSNIVNASIEDIIDDGWTVSHVGKNKQQVHSLPKDYSMNLPDIPHLHQCENAPENILHIFIPRILTNVSKARIVRTFEQQKIGKVFYIDAKFKVNNNNNAYGFAFVSVKVFDTEQVRTLRSEIKNTGVSKVVYDDPLYWEVKPYVPREKRESTIEIEPKALLKDSLSPLPVAVKTPLETRTCSLSAEAKEFEPVIQSDINIIDYRTLLLEMPSLRASAIEYQTPSTTSTEFQSIQSGNFPPGLEIKSSAVSGPTMTTLSFLEDSFSNVHSDWSGLNTSVEREYFTNVPYSGSVTAVLRKSTSSRPLYEGDRLSLEYAKPFSYFSEPSKNIWEFDQEILTIEQLCVELSAFESPNAYGNFPETTVVGKLLNSGAGAKEFDAETSLLNSATYRALNSSTCFEPESWFMEMDKEMDKEYHLFEREIFGNAMIV